MRHEMDAGAGRTITLPALMDRPALATLLPELAAAAIVSRLALNPKGIICPSRAPVVSMTTVSFPLSGAEFKSNFRDTWPR